MANFVERATLLVDDKSSANVKKINRELKSLFATANKLQRLGTKTLLPGIDARSLGTLRSLRREFDRINQMSRSSSFGFDSSRMRDNARLAAQIARDMERAARASRTFGRIPNPGQGGLGGQFNNRFISRRSDSDWQAAGRIIARTFVASIGVNLHQALMRAGRSAREGVTTEDTARANAIAMGLDVERAMAASRRAADTTLGISAGEILSASSEQIGSLEAQFRAGSISLEELNRRIEDTTMRIAQMAQIQSTALGDFRRGAEDARQIEKAVNLTDAGNDPVQRKAFADAIMNAIVASGGDIRGDEVKRMEQQLGSAFARSLSPEGLARLIMIRDEGGRQSTAEARTALQDLTRANINDEDMARQIERGLRDAQGRSTMFSEGLFADPVGAAEFFFERARAAGVDTNDSVAVATFLDNVEGFGTAGARLFAGLIPVIQEARIELERFRNTQAERLLENPTLVASFSEINASFQDAIARQTESLVPILTEGAQGLGNLIESVGKGNLTDLFAPSTIQTLLAGGIGLSMPALMDPATRPLATAGIGLNVAAANLNTAALALGASAGAGAFDLGGRRGGRGSGILNKLGTGGLGLLGGLATRLLGPVGVGAGALLLSSTNQAGERRTTEAHTLLREQAQLTAKIDQLVSQVMTTESANPFGVDLDRQQMLAELQQHEARLKAVNAELQHFPLMLNDAVRLPTLAEATEKLLKLIGDQAQRLSPDLKQLEPVRVSVREDTAARERVEIASRGLVGTSDQDRWRVGLDTSRQIDMLQASLFALKGPELDAATERLMKLRAILEAIGQSQWQMQLPGAGDQIPLPFSPTQDSGGMATVEEMDRVWSVNIEEHKVAIDTSMRAGAQSVATTMATEAPGWGQAIGGALGALMPGLGATLGAAAGQAIQASIANTPITVRQPQVRPEVGTLPPVE